MGSRRAAFSLAELVISIGILILMMALAGQVFTITIKSTGQATGLTEVTQQLRVLEETLREDLRNVQPGQSMMLIQGNPVNAYWTQLGKAADDDADPSNGYGHLRDVEREKLDPTTGVPQLDGNGNEVLTEPRADILMFFTARKATSAINPSVSSRVQQVVYGHAEMGEYQPDTASPGAYTMVPDIVASPDQSVFPVDSSTFYPSLTTASRVPAHQWHLARRSVLVIPTALDPTTISGFSRWSDIAIPAELGLQNKHLLHGAVDVVSEFSYDDLVVKPQPNPAGPGYIGQNWYLPQVFGSVAQPAPQFRPWSRCKMDPTPPMMMANRIGSYFLPNCASFKVEWSLDPSSPFVAGRLDRTSEVFWIDPGNQGADPTSVDDDDPLHALRARIKSEYCSKAKQKDPQYQFCQELSSLLCEQTTHAGGWFYSLADRFSKVPCDDSYGSQPWTQLSSDDRPNIAAFTATRPNVDPAIRELSPDDIWPGALRITVDLYDREFRLDRPIRHVMVIPIGG